MFNLFGNNRANNMPKSGPPKYTPEKGKGKKMNAAPTSPSVGNPSLKAVDPGAIFPCTNTFVYIWPNRGPGFWMYVTYVGRKSIAGWRLMGGRWRYFGMDLDKIDEFYCV